MSGKLRVLPLGGLGEIGKNMTVVEYDGKIVVVDVGLRFPTAEDRDHTKTLRKRRQRLIHRRKRMSLPRSAHIRPGTAHVRQGKRAQTLREFPLQPMSRATCEI